MPRPRLPAAETDRLRRAHSAFMVDLAERAEAGLYGPDEPVWARRVELWLDDLRAAWSWARDAGEVDLTVRLAAALTRTALAAVRRRLGDAAFNSAWAAGATRTLEEAADDALRLLDR